MLPSGASSSPSKKDKTRKWHYYSGPMKDENMLDFRIFSGSTSPGLTKDICQFLGVNLDKARVSSFKDGEIDIQIMTEVRGKEVFVVNSVCRSRTRSVNDALVELLLMISALKRASAGYITAIIPYFGYARQDRKMAGRVPISAADVAQMLVSMGVDRTLSVDLHCGQIQGFFPPHVPMDNLGAGPIGAAWFAEKSLVNPMIVSPDAGGVARAKNFREMLIQQGFPNTGLAMIIKQRSAASTIDQMDLVGSVAGSDCIIVDDMADTAGTLCKAAEILKKAGALKVHAFCTHGVFSEGAAKNISASLLDQMVVTNTVPLPAAMEHEPRLVVLDLAPILAEVIKRLHYQTSVSAIFTQQAAGLPALVPVAKPVHLGANAKL